MNLDKSHGCGRTVRPPSGPGLQAPLSSKQTMVCAANAFYLGCPVEGFKGIAIKDCLVGGATYLILPVERVTQGLATLSYDRVAAGAGRLIKATPEFLIGAIASSSKDGNEGEGDAGGEAACAGLRKHYEQLLGAARGRAWSPRLDTIKQRKGRMQRSPT
ncbi:hypothetical protein HU200_014125 [Digitaria exilis]|uniref:Uncharacterized protein n=1 Tax=Digitaria exilis TaxID=1010633 RepID=A0A835FCK8_9POAL|nr:hypothetical protein HU200_014125 [Digitaria exilis]